MKQSKYALRKFVCAGCGKSVELRRSKSTTKYCSHSCFLNNWAKTRKKRVPKNKTKCIVCGKKFISIMPHRKYCGSTCKYKNQYVRSGHKMRENWRRYYRRNKETLIPKKLVYFKNNPEATKRINNRATLKYKDKTRFDGNRILILSLHDNKCDNCGETSILHIHHKDGVSYWNTKRANNSLDNLMVLCASCHSRLHHQIRRMKTKSDTPSNRR